jgi:hypothetical protein
VKYAIKESDIREADEARTDAAGAPLPVIMATATSPAERPCDPWLQPVPILLKPYTAGELLETVKAIQRPTTP